MATKAGPIHRMEPLSSGVKEAGSIQRMGRNKEPVRELAAIAAQSPCGWAALRTQIPLGSGAAGASAALALLDDVQRHRLRRAALHPPPRRQERGPC